MSGRHSLRELTKEFTPERRRPRRRHQGGVARGDAVARVAPGTGR